MPHLLITFRLAPCGLLSINSASTNIIKAQLDLGTLDQRKTVHTLPYLPHQHMREKECAPAIQA